MAREAKGSRKEEKDKAKVLRRAKEKDSSNKKQNLHKGRACSSSSRYGATDVARLATSQMPAGQSPCRR